MEIESTHNKDIEIRSEEVQEILGTPPKWIVRWGTTMTLIVLLILGWGSWAFKYPERVEAPITITSTIPPTNIIAPTTGYIDLLFVEDGDTAKIGDFLGIIQNPTSFEDVIRLETYLTSFDALNENASLDIPAPNKGLVLNGDLQRSYSNFIQAYETYEFGTQGSSERQAENRLQRQISKLKENNRINEQRKIETNRRIEQLSGLLKDKQSKYADQKISVSELEETSEQIEALRRSIDGYDIEINENDLEIERLRNQIADNVQRLKQENISSYINLSESLQRLNSAIETWKQKYILTAQREGLVAFYNVTEATKKYFTAGETVLTILPLETTIEDGENAIIGEVSIPISGSGKVAQKQLVKVRFDSYPAHEYGLVLGEVAQKSRLPKAERYIIDVRFPNGLITNKGIELNFDQQMTGKATIITQDKRFIQRIFDRVIAIFT